MTVLEGPFYIKENLDPTLSFRASCRMGGSCAIRISGKPKLACDKLGKVAKIEPLKNFNVIRDLVTDFEGFFKEHEIVEPYPGEIRLKRVPLCVKCGACISACPVSKNCLGPMPAVSAYRFNEDSRDEVRLRILGDHVLSKELESR